MGSVDLLPRVFGIHGWLWCIGLAGAILSTLNLVHAASAGAYLADLRAAADEVRAKGLRDPADLRTDAIRASVQNAAKSPVPLDLNFS